MDPILFWVFVFAWMLQRGAVDGLYAFRGKPNPRYELKKQRAAAAGNAVAQPRYGTRDWFSDLYSDALTAHTERRRKKAEAAGRPVDDMVDVVREPADVVVPEAEDEPPPSATVATPPRVDQLRPSKSDASPVDAVDRVMAGIVAARVSRRPPGMSNCARCGREAHLDDMTPMSNGKDVQFWCNRHEKPVKPEAAETDGPIAPVINLFRNNPKEIVMPNVNGEVTGLDPAISYAKALAGFAGEHGQAGNEGYIGFLTNSKVTGAALQSAHDMQEAFANATASAERHAAELEKQKTVQEAYDQNPDAGDKQFQQSGR